ALGLGVVVQVERTVFDKRKELKNFLGLRQEHRRDIGEDVLRAFRRQQREDRRRGATRASTDFQNTQGPTVWETLQNFSEDSPYHGVEEASKGGIPVDVTFQVGGKQ